MFTYLPTADAVDFSGSWTTFWGAASPELNSIVTLLGIIGLLMVAGGIIMWIYRKSRGGGGNTSGLVWTIVIGGILAGPNFLIPIILNVVDFFINTIASVLSVA